MALAGDIQGLMDELVADEELLFRSVPRDAVSWHEGKLKLSSQAFLSRECQPSVNRATIRPDPELAKIDSDHAVAQLIAGRVRSIKDVVHNPNAPQSEKLCYRLDVVAKPVLAGKADGEAENLAHAEIHCHPTVSRNRYQKVKEALARVAEAMPLALHSPEQAPPTSTTEPSPPAT
jgi:hypothetical protein